MKLRPSSVALAAMTAVASTYACYGATEVTLDVTTDVPCPPPNAPRDQQLDVGVFVNATQRADTQQCESRATGNEIGTIVVAPNGARDQQVLAQVVIGTGGTPADRCLATAPDGRILALDPTCILARRAIGLVPHESLTVPIRLYASCRGTLCPDDQTCSAGACVPAACKGAGCSDPGPPFPTAPPSDASSDATVDAGPVADALPPVDAGASCSGVGTVVLSNVAAPGGAFGPRIALGKNHIFWVDASGTNPQLQAVALDGTVETLGALPTASADGALLANDDAVWYSTNAGVVEYTITGGGANLVSSAKAKAFAWTSHGGGRGTLYFLDLAGNVYGHTVGAPSSNTATGFVSGIELLEASANTLYAYQPAANTLYRWSYTSNPTSTTLAGAVTMAAGSGTVFFATGTGNAVGEIVDGTSTVKSIGTANQAKSITVDGKNLYLVEHTPATGSELRIGKLDTTAVALNASGALEADVFANMSNVVVSGRCAYVWAIRAANPGGAILAYSTK